jgi:WhiB family transcriptional regulator, redox-sensing transcriptional regulator
MAVEVSRQSGQRTQDIEVLMTAIDNRAEWWSDAACSTADPELFFPVSSLGPALRQVAQAKAICARCHIQQACLRYALDAGPVQGIWGGTAEAERRRLRQCERHAPARLAQEQATGPVLARPAPSP